MRTAALVVLAAALAACGKAPKTPAAPTPAAVGAELATFPQLLVPISTTTWAGMQKAIALNDMTRANAVQYPQPYAHYTVQIGTNDLRLRVVELLEIADDAPERLEGRFGFQITNVLADEDLRAD